MCHCVSAGVHHRRSVCRVCLLFLFFFIFNFSFLCCSMFLCALWVVLYTWRLSVNVVCYFLCMFDAYLHRELCLHFEIFFGRRVQLCMALDICCTHPGLNIINFICWKIQSDVSCLTFSSSVFCPCVSKYFSLRRNDLPDLHINALTRMVRQEMAKRKNIEMCLDVNVD